MKSFAFAATMAAANALSTVEFDYMNYMAQYNKVINDVEEFAMRAANFDRVDAFINEHNSSNSTYTAGHNQFSDWTEAEYKQILGYVRGERSERKTPVKLPENMNADSVNWVEAGAVTPVKDQGQCGSCWAFSSTGSLEGAHFVATGDLKSFSEQQLVDCAYLKYGNYACNGGLQDNAYKYYEDGNNAEIESVYPYTSGTSKSKGDCAYDSSSATAVTVSNYTTIEADKVCFQTYKSGVFNNPKCGTTLDHAVLAVGYGVEGGQEYWLVKNSWNTTWGDQGYIKLAITGDDAGMCGVQQDAEWPETN